ncbi:MAG: FAD-binding oxidoreductase, partial [Dehalococcoidales bacterium]|nr:FAD-binding oxidoreductase [Dehalococcoidales bacterium]
MTTAAKPDARQGDLVFEKLKKAIGAEKVKTDEAVLVSYASDPPPVFHKPGCVVLPESKEDVKAILKFANEYKIPVTPAMRGVNLAGYTLADDGGILMDMRRMNKIIEINTDSGYAVIEAGVNFDKLTTELLKVGYRLAIPTAPGGSAVLGNALSRPTNSMCSKNMDAVMDLEVVLPDGTTFHTGSAQFPHAGSHMRYGPHPDLAGLFTCAYGTMGVVVSGAVRIYTINEANRVNLAAFDTYADSVDFVKDLLNNNIPEHCIIWHWGNYEAFAVDVSKPGTTLPPHLLGDPRVAPEGKPYNIVTTFMSGYEETMVAHEKVIAKVARKYNGRAIPSEEAERIMPVAKMGWEILYGKYHQIEPTFFGLGRYMVWIMLTEPKDVKKMEQYAVEELSKCGVRPVCYYSQPFDSGRSIFFRIFC